jgi:hypothetical protein
VWEYLSFTLREKKGVGGVHEGIECEENVCGMKKGKQIRKLKNMS